jgi:hypothetical protein
MLGKETLLLHSPLVPSANLAAKFSVANGPGVCCLCEKAQVCMEAHCGHHFCEDWFVC